MIGVKDLKLLKKDSVKLVKVKDFKHLEDRVE